LKMDDLLRACEKLDRIFKRDDVVGIILVHVIQQRIQSGGFAGAGDAGE